MGHRSHRVAVALPRTPGAQLRREVRRGLSSERRVAPPGSFAARPVAGGAWLDPAFRVAFKVENRRNAICCPVRRLGLHRQFGVIGGKPLARRPIHPFGNPAHLQLAALAAGEEVHLAREIAGVEARQTRREVAVALAPQSVAGDAGRFRPRVPAAQCDQLSGRLEAVVDRLRCGAGAKKHSQDEER